MLSKPDSIRDIMKPLIIFELANNHQGSLEHALKIVNGLEQLKKPHEEFFEFAVKFQFRDLDTFLDPASDPSSNKHIARFHSTQLDDFEWSSLTQAVRDKGFLPLTTPFDEQSVETASNLGFSTLKIASCSAQEWPLLQKACVFADDLIVSTAGLKLDEIDALYSYLRHECRGSFSILHCIGIYPAPLHDLQLSTIHRFIQRYPKARIGYSGHEPPTAHHVSTIALALGAQVFERHIGHATSEISLNAYSLDLDDVENWLSEMAATIQLLGEPKSSKYFNQGEHDSLKMLRRGVFAKTDIPADQEISPDLVTYHFPIRERQFDVSEFTTIYHRFTSTRAIAAGEPLRSDNSQFEIDIHSQNLDHFVQRIRGIATEAHIEIADDELLEISHHFGVSELWSFGCCIVNVLNRSYCKKLILMTEGQDHPEQFHRIKEETLRVVFGEVEFDLDGSRHKLKEGQSIVVEANARHRFKALTDVVIEELSTTSSADDSYYTNTRISSRPRTARKTVIRNFNRYSD
jgi:sialic acid synthase SpsE/mannose-6-phosphate isomerase-like protein (cupin superfamily)